MSHDRIIKTVEDLASWAGLMRSLVLQRAKLHGWDWPGLLAPSRTRQPKRKIAFKAAPYKERSLFAYLRAMSSIKSALTVAARQCRPGAESALNAYEVFAKFISKKAEEKSRERTQLVKKAELKRQLEENPQAEEINIYTNKSNLQLDILKLYRLRKYVEEGHAEAVKELAEETCVDRALGDIVRHRQTRCVVIGRDKKHYQVMYSDESVGIAHPYDLYDINKEDKIILNDISSWDVNR